MLDAVRADRGLIFCERRVVEFCQAAPRCAINSTANTQEFKTNLRQMQLNCVTNHANWFRHANEWPSVVDIRCTAQHAVL